MTKNRKKEDPNNKEIMEENQSTGPETQPTEATAQAAEESTPTDSTTPEQQVIEQQAAELAAANDKYLRLYAEFDNYKRRVARERVELMQSAGKEIIANLLPVIDDFDRALKAFETTTAVEPLKEGVSLVGQKLKNILAQQGLKEMESIGKPFDAELQEAITNIPAPSDDLKGKVVDEVEKGYFLHDRVLRYAKVVVGN